MALGQREDFEMFSGDDLDLVVTVVDADSAVVNITGADPVRWQLGRLATGAVIGPSHPGQPLVSKAISGGIVVASGISGILTISLDDTDTAALRGGDYYHELEMVLGGKRTTVMYGVVTLRSDLVE